MRAREQCSLCVLWSFPGAFRRGTCECKQHALRIDTTHCGLGRAGTSPPHHCWIIIWIIQLNACLLLLCVAARTHTQKQKHEPLVCWRLAFEMAEHTAPLHETLSTSNFAVLCHTRFVCLVSNDALLIVSSHHKKTAAGRTKTLRLFAFAKH